MIRASYVDGRLDFYFDKETSDQIVAQYGDVHRVNVETHDNVILIRPAIDGQYSFSEAKAHPGRRKFQAFSKRFTGQIPAFGRIKITDYSLLPSGIRISLPEELPEPKTLHRRKRRKQTTSTDVIRDLETLRAPQVVEVPRDLNEEALLIVRFQGKEYKMEMSPPEALRFLLNHLS